MLYRILEKIIIPANLKNEESIKLIHLTDTPSQNHKELKHLIAAIKPDYIVHTGDICDDIKLERSPRKIDLYDRKIAHFSKLMAPFQDTKFYFVIGNHDDYSIVRKYFPDAIIFEERGCIENELGIFCVGHEFKAIKNLHADYFLFGHDMTQNSILTGDQRILNGLENIYVIHGTPAEITAIEYPYSTDSLRQKKSWRGL
jgi:predicted phosphodiesterase